ncbi:MAG: hypothetical protein M5R42_15240 [Rhodocyclaceae bacterium]|nr:hypothetical protein [Rhodocyclaceae bacterium]
MSVCFDVIVVCQPDGNHPVMRAAHGEHAAGIFPLMACGLDRTRRAMRATRYVEASRARHGAALPSRTSSATIY